MIQLITVPSPGLVVGSGETTNVILVQSGVVSKQISVPPNQSNVKVASSADTLWEADGTGYIRPKGGATVKGENVEIDISGKVDKVEGYGLSENNFSDDDVTKLAGLENFDDTAVLSAISEVDAKTLKSISFCVQGELAVGENVLSLMVPFFMNIIGVYIKARVFPVGADIIVDLNRNGTTIYTTQANRPTVPDGESGSLVDILPEDFELGTEDILTLDIDQVGSTTPGTDLMVTLICEFVAYYDPYAEV